MKLRETLQSLYKEYQYSAKALRELRNLTEALKEKVSRPLNVFGARWLPHLQTALKIIFDGYKVLVMHSENTKEGRVGSAGRLGRATFSAKFLTFLRGPLFAHLTWDIVEEAAYLSKVFQADFTTVTRAMAAVNNFRLRLMKIKRQIARDDWCEPIWQTATFSGALTLLLFCSWVSFSALED